MQESRKDTWTQDDDEKLEGLLSASNSVAKIAVMMERDEDDVLDRCYKLDLLPRFPHP